MAPPRSSASQCRQRGSTNLRRPLAQDAEEPKDLAHGGVRVLCATVGGEPQAQVDEDKDAAIAAPSNEEDVAGEDQHDKNCESGESDESEENEESDESEESEESDEGEEEHDDVEIIPSPLPPALAEGGVATHDLLGPVQVLKLDSDESGKKSLVLLPKTRDRKQEMQRWVFTDSLSPVSAAPPASSMERKMPSSGAAPSHAVDVEATLHERVWQD